MVGDFPLLDVMKVANDSDVTVSRSETTKGVPEQDTVSLTMEGAVSMPFVVSTTDSVSYFLDNLRWSLTQM